MPDTSTTYSESIYTCAAHLDQKMLDGPHGLFCPRSGHAIGGYVDDSQPSATWLEAGWMQTYTGRQFFPMRPRAEDVAIADIAHALSMICRYGGHTRRFYSVAEHCWLMSYAVPAEHALAALMHDATEAYVGDMVRPLKHQLPTYMTAEDRVAEAIAERFGGSPIMPPEVKEADNRILLDERAALMSPPPHEWQVEDLQPLGVTIRAFWPAEAERVYLERFDELTIRRFM